MERKFFSVCLVLVLCLYAFGQADAMDSGVSETPDAQARYMSVVEISERIYEGGPSLAVILSEKLDPAKSHDDFLEVSVDGAPVPGSWILSDNGQILYFPNVEPDTKYTVLVRRTISSQSGLNLAAHVEETLTTKSIQPSFGFADQGAVLPERLTSGLPVMTINVDQVDIEFLRVKDEHIVKFMQMADMGSSTDRWDLDQMSSYVESVYMARFNTHGEKNKRSITNVAVEDIEQLSQPGFYIAVMRAPGRFVYREQTSYFFVSDIGLHVRKYENRMEMVCSSLNTGEALPDVRIVVYDDKGDVLARGYSDKDGMFGFSGLSKNPCLVMARSEKHVSFVSIKGAALDLSGFTIDGPVFKPMEIFVYAPRDLYRPGETVDFSALLRNYDGRLGEPLPMNARIKRPDGKEASRFTWRQEVPGYCHRAFALPDDSPTGRWSLELRTDPADKNPSHVFYFRVEEFLPERMKLILETEQKIIAPRENFIVQVSGDYLYGAPASGSRFTASANVRRNVHPLESLKDFHFGNPDDDMRDSRNDLIDEALDENGKGFLSFQPLSVPATSPMRVTVTGNLYESGGRPVTRSISRTLWPARQLVGIRPLFDDDRCQGQAMVGFEAARTDPDGNLLQASGLQATLVKEDRDYYWEYDENQGWHWKYSEVNYPVHRDAISMEQGKVAEFSMPVEYGRYRLEISDQETGLVTLYRFYAGWGGDETADSSRPDKVQLSLDKPGYQPGDTAVLTIKPPHAGDAMVLVEADEPLWYSRLAVPAEGIDIQIPVSANWDRNDIYVTAMVFRGASSEKKIAPNRAVGIVHFPLDRTGRKLEVSIDAPESMEPENTLKATVKIDNLPPGQSKAAYVTLAAVDVGVLNITDFKTPDPFEFFFARRRYQTDMYDLYNKVIENMDGPKATLAYGGDADLGGFRGSKRDRAEVKIVSLFSGPVAVNDQGEAAIEFYVPDFNGRARLMALAFAADDFGSQDAEVVIKAPIVAELAAPRFLAAGDKSTASLDLHNMSGKDREIVVKVSAEGPLSIENGQFSVALKDNEKTTARMPLLGTDNFGVGKINVSLQSEEIQLSRTWELSVRPAHPGIVRSERKVLQPGEKMAVDPAMGDKIMANTLDVHMAVSPDPPLNLADILERLLKYPYGCLEQTVSRAFPYLYLDSAAASRLGVEAVGEAKRRESVEKALVRIAGMQKSGGGFSLWSSDGPEALWLTPYAAHFLLEAKERGFDVPDTMLQNALENLDDKLKTTQRFSVRVRESSPELVFADKAYRAYVLARLNRAQLGTLRNLFDNHRKIVSTTLPLVHLGIALRMMGDISRGDQAIAEGLAKNREGFYYIGDYGSRLRDKAMAIHLLKRHDIPIPDMQSLIYTLDDLLRNRRYFSTQEQNAMFLAGLSLMDNKKDWSGDMAVGENSTPIASSERYVKRFDAQSLAQGICFQNNSEIPLYASAQVSGYPQTAPEPEEEHATISRSYYRLDGQPVADLNFKTGDLIVAHLRIVGLEDMVDALVIDLLPAGLELENQNLTHSEKLDDIKIQGVDLKEEMENQSIRHMEFRDDRFVAAIELYKERAHHLLYLVRAVTPGTYIMPAPYLEDMYRPEIRAIGKESGEVSVGE